LRYISKDYRFSLKDIIGLSSFYMINFGSELNSLEKRLKNI